MSYIRLAQLIVAAGTLILAGVTVWAILSARYWNKRHEKATLEWNKRNEWTRTLPFLSIEKAELRDPTAGWVTKLYVYVKNIGLGPAVTYRVKANQGKRALPNLGYTHAIENVFTYRSLEAGGDPHRCYFKNASAPPKKEPDSVMVNIRFCDVFGHTHEIVYKLEPLKGPQGDWLKRLGDPSLVTLKLNGKVIELPQDDSSNPSEYEDNAPSVRFI